MAEKARSLRDHPVFAALGNLLPERRETRLLQALLRPADSPQKLWDRWAEDVGNPKRFFENNRTGLKGLLPFVEHSLRKREIEAGKEFTTYTKVACLREELRTKIYFDVFDEVIASLSKSSIHPIGLRACSLSETVYDTPYSRHNHAIDLLVRSDECAGVAEILSRLAFEPVRSAQTDGSAAVAFQHSTGLPLSLSSTLFDFPYLRAPMNLIRARLVKTNISESEVLTLSPADSLVDILVRAATSRTRSNLRWACDAWLILARQPKLNWEHLREMAGDCYLALPLARLLTYLGEELDAPLLERSIAELLTVTSPEDGAEMKVAQAMLLANARSHTRVLRLLAPDRRRQIEYIRYALMPPAEFLRWQLGTNDSMPLLAQYAYRPIRFLARRLSLSPQPRTSGTVDLSL